MFVLFILIHGLELFLLILHVLSMLLLERLHDAPLPLALATRTLFLLLHEHILIVDLLHIIQQLHRLRPLILMSRLLIY